MTDDAVPWVEAVDDDDDDGPHTSLAGTPRRGVWTRTVCVNRVELNYYEYTLSLLITQVMHHRNTRAVSLNERKISWRNTGKRKGVIITDAL